MDLHVLGIEENMFFLRLYDRTLKKVDPHSPFLTDDQIIRIVNECIINPWYYLRECARIPDQGGTGIPYQLHRGNLAATWCYLHGIDHYFVVPRQKGKTQSQIAILCWTFLLGTTNSEFMFLNMNQEEANKNLDRLRKQRDLLPHYLQFKTVYSEEGKILKDADNVKTLVNPINNNKIIAKPSAKSIEAAEKIGRGSTQPQIILKLLYKPLVWLIKLHQKMLKEIMLLIAEYLVQLQVILIVNLDKKHRL